MENRIRELISDRKEKLQKVVDLRESYYGKNKMFEDLCDAQIIDLQFTINYLYEIIDMKS